MKKLISIGIAAILALGTGTAFADGKKGHGNRGGNDGFVRVSNYLDLTDEQEMQMLELRQEAQREMLVRRQELSALRDAGEEIDRETLQAEIAAKREEAELALQGILTAEQWMLFQERAAERDSDRGNRRGNRGRNDDTQGDA